MEFRIEKEPVISVTGLSIDATNKDGKNFTDIPAFWEQVMGDGRLALLGTRAAGSRLGVVGVCYEFDMTTGLFKYAIAIETPKDFSGLPDGCITIEVPASTWAKFTARGPLHPNLQDTVKRIFSEWFPSSGREHAGTAEIEYYSDNPDCNSADYWCEYWVPLK